jgi:spore photoproduct lyase
MPFQEVYVDPALEEHPVVQRIRYYEHDPREVGKRVLMIRPYEGRLVKSCPGTMGHICCGYKVINVMNNCPMDCSYCILQVYLNNPCVTLYPEFAQVLREIEEMLDAQPHRIFRFGTGELGDSLTLDGIIGFAQETVPFFADKRNGILELKTKASNVDHLLGLDHRGRTVCSWSLNPQNIIEEEEHLAASLDERLHAARLCSDAGYHLGFHFDPLIYYPGWEEDYRSIVDLLSQHIDPGRVIWVSLGALRYPPALKQVAQERFPNSPIFSGELIVGEDGKLRYLKPIRIQMYRKLVSWLQEWSEDLFVYLCMEREDVWQEVFGSSPRSTEGLNRRFEERCTRFMRNGQ